MINKSFLTPLNWASALKMTFLSDTTLNILYIIANLLIRARFLQSLCLLSALKLRSEYCYLKSFKLCFTFIAHTLLAVWRYRSKKKLFKRNTENWKDTDGGRQTIDENFKKVKKYCKVVRAICHTQVGSKVFNKPRSINVKFYYFLCSWVWLKVWVRRKLTWWRFRWMVALLLIRWSGSGNTWRSRSQLAMFSLGMKWLTALESPRRMDSMVLWFAWVSCTNDLDLLVLLLTGVIFRWHSKKLLRKTHEGLRKVACIGAWHPSRVQFSVARAGQKGYHHRTEANKKIYRIGGSKDPSNASTDFDPTPKRISPMVSQQDYIVWTIF